MREISFRGKTLKGHIEYGDLIYKDNCTFIHFYDCNNFECEYEVDDVTVGQYTGTKDKNNKKIYEGDILEYKNSLEWGIGKVYWCKSSLSFGLYFIKPKIEDTSLFYFQCKEEIEVIGNIYDNKELLE